MMKFFNKLRNLPKRYVLALILGLVLALPVLAMAGYGPNRPVFDWNNPDDRKGSMTGPVFNSFINTPSYGDERAFVDAKDAANTQTGGFADTVDVQPGKEYTVRAYVHNNANQGTNASGLGVAKNSQVRFKILDGMANGNEVTGYISADNATPTVVYDTVKLKNDTRAFALSYVPGSARIENNAHPYPGIALPDSIVTTGAKIGYDQMNGNVPGCFEFTAIVTIKVKVTAPDLEIAKGVSTLAAPKRADLKESVTVKPGDKVTWRIDYKNNGSTVANTITIRDQLPKGLTLVPGTITWIDVNHPNGEVLQDTALGSGGVNVGNYAPNGNGVIRFQTTVDANVKDCELVNVAFGRAKDIPEQSDTAKVVISPCQEEQKPVYNCDALKATLISDNKYRFSVDATALGGATVKQYRFTFGDGSQGDITDKNTVEHTFPGPGSYVIVATVDFNVNGSVQSATSANCRTTLKISENPPVTPPTELPSTGPEAVAGMFASTTLAGAISHRLFYGRRRR